MNEKYEICKRVYLHTVRLRMFVLWKGWGKERFEKGKGRNLIPPTLMMTELLFFGVFRHNPFQLLFRIFPL